MLKLVGLKALVVGGGGRENTLIDMLRRSPRVAKVFTTGNGGMHSDVETIDIPQVDFAALADFVQAKEIDLTIVQMDDLLAAGIVDYFTNAGLAIFGPNQAAAQIESSKVWAKDLMALHGIPTAGFRAFSNQADAFSYATKMLADKGKVVIKADGLAQGKGVVICDRYDQIILTLDKFMNEKVHGDAGNVVIVEEFLEGTEVSFHVLVDEKGNYQIFPIVMDHKDYKGRNTGGMGVVGPVPIITPEQIKYVEESIIWPLLTAMNDEGARFTGLLYPGLIITADGIKVLEFNCRFGDPETQVFGALLETDIVDIIEACLMGLLNQIKIIWKKAFATCVAMISEGYPGAVTKKGMKITGVGDARDLPGVDVVYAGAKLDADGDPVNWGGRVLYVVATRPTLEESISAAYEGVKLIHFDGAQFSETIGAKCVKKIEAEVEE